MSVNKLLLGIDVGTTGTKSLIFNPETGLVEASAYREYSVSIPSEGAAEQDPEMWWRAVCETIQSMPKELVSNVGAVGYSGQMHGLIALGTDGRPVRPAIIWLDQRSKDVAKSIQDKLGMEKMGKIIHNRVYSGFAFPSLLWVRENEPDVYNKIDKIMVAKDYVRYKMTGETGTDASDLSATSMGDVRKRNWAWDLIDDYGLDRSIFADVHEATDIAGLITKECSEQTGLPIGIPVVYGSGDAIAASVGCGQISEGDVICNIGTGGQITIYSAEDMYDEKLRLQSFCHGINKAYTVFGAVLSSGLSLKWGRDNLKLFDNYKDSDKMAASIPAGCEGLTFLPYLSGERTPLMNPDAKGVFYGVRLAHDQRHFARAIMEGVVYAFKDSLNIFDELGKPAERVIASGGGANSPLWLQMQADVYRVPVITSTVREQACLGACIIAGVGTGILSSFEKAKEDFITYDEKIYEPDKANFDLYSEGYARYIMMRETLDPVFRKC